MLKYTLRTLLTLGSVTLLPALCLSQARSLQQEISGTVVHDGQPVPGATVVILGNSLYIPDARLAENSPTITRRIRTDENGRFSTRLPCWRYFSLYAEQADKELTSPVLESVTAPRHDIQLELAPAWAFEGKLTWRGRAPGEILGMRLRRMTTKPRSATLIVEGKSGDDGSFSFRGLPPGPWQLKLNGRKRRLAAPVVISKSGGNHEIPLARGYTLTVRAATARGILGKAIPGVKVRILDTVQFYETTGDQEGRFVLQGVEKGPGATFVLEAPDHCKKIYALEPGLDPKDPAPQAEVQVSEGRQSQGRIIDEMGNPVPGLTVLYAGIVHPSGVSVGDLSVSTKTDKDGVYSTNALDPAAVFDVFALLPGGEPIQLGRINPHQAKKDFGTFRLGSHRLDVALKLEKDLQLPPNHKLRIYGPKEGGEFTKSVALHRTRGYEFRTPSMIPGEYVVIFASRTLGISRKKVFIASAGKAKPGAVVPIMVTRPRLIEGTLVMGKDQVVPNRRVQLVVAGANAEGGSMEWTDMVVDTVRSEEFPPKEYPTSVTSDAQGKFKIWCLESSGNYDLLVGMNDQASQPEVAPPMAPMRITNILGRPSPLTIRVQ